MEVLEEVNHVPGNQKEIDLERGEGEGAETLDVKRGEKLTEQGSSQSSVIGSSTGRLKRTKRVK